MRFLRSILFFAACALAAGCRDSVPPPPASTTAPTTIAATAPVVTGARIVSLVPAATLNLVLMHASDHLVGGTQWDRIYLPKEQAGLQVVGDYDNINYEMLVNLHPTAVIVQKDIARLAPRIRELADSQHFEIVNIRLDKIDDIWTTARELGRIAGKPEAADEAIALAKAELKQVADEFANDKRPHVLYVATPSDMMIAGGETIMGEMVTLAGGEILGPSVGNVFPVLGKEAIVNLAPEVILLGAPDQPGQINNDPRLEMWQSLPTPAARQHRIFLVTGGNSQMASLEIGKDVRALADLIHKQPSGSKP